MKIEAGIVPVSVRFEKLCKNYALRILQMQNTHPVKQRVPFNSSFSSENNEINLTKIDNYQLANWNQDIAYSESETEPEFHSQRSKTRRKKKRISLAPYCYLALCFLSSRADSLAPYCHLVPCFACWHRTAISRSAPCQAELTRWHHTATSRPAPLAGTVLLSRALLSVKKS